MIHAIGCNTKELKEISAWAFSETLANICKSFGSIPGNQFSIHLSVL
jgi:hypothetical protein